MQTDMAFSAQRNQVVFRILTRVAAKLEVVHLQMLHATAYLAAPTITLQHTALQFAVAFRFEPPSRLLGPYACHESAR